MSSEKEQKSQENETIKNPIENVVSAQFISNLTPERFKEIMGVDLETRPEFPVNEQGNIENLWTIMPALFSTQTWGKVIWMLIENIGIHKAQSEEFKGSDNPQADAIRTLMSVVGQIGMSALKESMKDEISKAKTVGIGDLKAEDLKGEDLTQND